MNKALKKSWAAALGMLMLASCDVIDEPLKDGVIITPPDTAKAQRVVLLEEFTGVRCNNCPDAAKEAKRLRGIYGDQVVLVAIHATSLAEPDAKHPVDFTTPEGDDLANFFNLPGVPIGFVDRRGYAGSGAGILKPYPQWATEMEQAMNEPLVANLKIAAVSNGSNGSTQVTVQLSPLTDLSTRDIWINVILLEDSIVAPQTLPDKTIQDDYVHNHVYRSSFNGAYGEPIPAEQLAPGENAEFQFDLTLASDWAKPNCEVVAFIYDHDNYQILQAAHRSL